MSQSALSENSYNHSTNKEINSRIAPWLANIVYPLGCYVVLPTYFASIQITGQENIPQNHPVIVAPTHRSRWDALLVPYAVGRLASGRDLRFMVMSSEMQGFQGWLIRRLGGFPVDIKHPAASSLTHSIELLSQGEMLVIFPEGGIFQDDQVQPLKRGVARIALDVEEKHPQLGIKILPITVSYSELQPRWGTEVNINIGKAIDVSNYRDYSPKTGSEKLTAELQTTLNLLNQ